jgi:hypothetical protein
MSRPPVRRRSASRAIRRLWPRALKRRLPTSLFGRSLLIIVLPVALMQVAVTWAFFDAHWQTVTSRLAQGLAGEVAWAVESFREDPADLPRIADMAERTMNLSIAFQPGRDLPTTKRYALFAPVDRSLKQAFTARLDQKFWFDTVRYPAYVDIRVKGPGRAAHHCPARPCLRHPGPHLHPLDGRRHPAADGRGHPVHPQPGARH